MQFPFKIFVFFLLLCLFTTCKQAGDSNFKLVIKEIRSPAGPGSGQPNLITGKDDNVYLSWLEPSGTGSFKLLFSTYGKKGWLEAKTIVSGDNFFVNWADFPSVVSFGNGDLAAHWLAKSAEEKYAYDVKLTRSNNGGRTWGKALSPHSDGTPTEHGFVSMLPSENGQLFVTWLDGRNFVDIGNGATNEMQLRSALIDKNNTVLDALILDPLVCECCQTSAALTENGLIIAYRDLSQEDIRDISIIRFENNRWSEPKTLHHDNWEIRGCPVNGPAIAANGNQVAIAWFTAANDSPKVKIKFSNDGGTTFGQAIQVNEQETVGRVDVVLLPDGTGLVSWLENRKDAGEILLRRIHPDGKKEDAISLSKSTTERASGFPQMALRGDKIYFAWTQTGNPPTIRSAAAEVN